MGFENHEYETVLLWNPIENSPNIPHWV